MSKECEESRASFVQGLLDHPDIPELMFQMLGEMVGEDEEAWAATIARAEKAVEDELTSPVAYVNAAQAMFETVGYLLFDCGVSPRELLSIVEGG